MPDHHDDDLVTELRALGRSIEVPEPADQRAAVRARLTAQPRARWHARRWLVSAVAAIAATVAVVAPARAAVVDAVGDLLRVAGIEVRREPAPGGLPARPSPLPSPGRVTLDEARRAALFPVRVPAALGTPEQVVVADPDPAGAPRVVSMSFRGGAVRFDQFDGGVDPAFYKSAPEARWTEIGTSTAIWVPGPHPVTYVDRDGAERTETARLAGPTLVWSSDAVTYRLEGFSSLEEARTVALSLA